MSHQFREWTKYCSWWAEKKVDKMQVRKLTNKNYWIWKASQDQNNRKSQGPEEKRNR